MKVTVQLLLQPLTLKQAGLQYWGGHVPMWVQADRQMFWQL